jgi:CubicO group peptidase (beta-lactamase class C family)
MLATDQEDSPSPKLRRFRLWKRVLLVLLGLIVVSTLGTWARLDPEGPWAERAVGIACVDPELTGVFPSEQWERVENLSTAGVDADKLERARSLCKPMGAAAVVIVYDGRLLLTWGFPSYPYPCHSVRKSILNALFGIAVAEDKVRLDNTLAQLGIDDQIPLTSAEKQATVGDLLRARSGVYLPSNNSSANMRARMPPRGSHAPGTFWFYNNWDFNALGTIYGNATGESMFAAFQRQIAVPLEMEHFDPGYHTRWNNDGVSVHPGYEFSLSALDLARFGLLYARGGRWKERQIVPASWVTESTTAHSDVEDGAGGYGYMWWIESIRHHLPEYGADLEGSFSAEGIGGHCVLVIPKRKLVIVVRADTRLPSWFPLTATRVDRDKLTEFLRLVLGSQC